MSLVWPPILSRVGGDALGASWALSVLIQATLNVVLFSWLTIPLVVKLLGAWLDRPRPACIDATPWRELDQGLPRTSLGFAIRLAACLAVYTPLLIATIRTELALSQVVEPTSSATQ